MGANDHLSALSYGLSTGGSAGSAETTSTLGADALNARQPPTAYQVDNLQITQCKNLLIRITQDLKGGTRLRVRTQTDNPFGATESGFYMDTSGHAYKVYNGTRSRLAAIAESVVTATFAAEEEKLISFPTPSGTYIVSAGAPNVTSGDAPSSVWCGAPSINGANTEVTVYTAGSFTGTINVFILVTA